MKGCIFDLDGVVCDTAKYHFLAWKKLANQLNINFFEKDNERLKGVSRMNSLKILLSLGTEIYSQEQMEQFAILKNQWYVDYISHMGKDELLPGVYDFIMKLKQNGIKIALGSVSKNAPLILDCLDIRSCFDAVVDGNIVSAAKPNPEVFLTGAKLLGLEPEECIVFEDAAAGVQAAHNANMKCIGIGNKDILNEADFVITTFENLDPNLEDCLK